MKTLGIDLGDKRIGVAVSDQLRISAQGLTTLRRENDDKLIEDIKEIILREGVREIVVGLPLNMDGSQGERAKKSVKFSERLETETGLSVTLWDERLSTVEVERLMVSANTSRKKRKRKIDKLAAQLILQGYLNSKKSKSIGDINE